MLALDFKLTSGQVRALLYVYAMERLTDVDSRRRYNEPVVKFFNTSHFITCTAALIRRGLVVHKPWTSPAEYMLKHETIGHFLTDEGRAIVKIILQQARHIAALGDLVEPQSTPYAEAQHG